eukprot:TRINITY_DN525_c0_g2_i2.p1 TRINITY_DN525_c0_g2~~TRINITY_DN525_c0_g2_i2.p1  ORF type:complete len:358 (-),score=65.05 TRINITY_DN525_c0_g2_i2:493-1566(-)
MGQSMSCRMSYEHTFFSAVQIGDMEAVQSLAEKKPRLLEETTVYERLSPLHIAAANGRISVLSWLLDQGFDPDAFNRHKQTPLMMAAMYGQVSCLERLLEAGANILLFDSLHGRTCLHYAANYGHSHCLQVILAAAQVDPIADTWRVPYAVALKYKHSACAAILNPRFAGPLIWPSAWKFIHQLNPEAKTLLENALMEANKAREKSILFGDASPANSMEQEDDLEDNISQASESEVCCICFDRLCTLEIENCGHRMCAPCTLALCCQNKANPSLLCSPPPLCPFCRRAIAQLAPVTPKSNNRDMDSPTSIKPKQSKSLNEDSSSFRTLSAKGSFGRMGGKGSGKVTDSSNWVEKLQV